jgi:hypothetical protein
MNIYQKLIAFFHYLLIVEWVFSLILENIVPKFIDTFFKLQKDKLAAFYNYFIFACLFYLITLFYS